MNADQVPAGMEATRHSQQPGQPGFAKNEGPFVSRSQPEECPTHSATPSTGTLAARDHTASSSLLSFLCLVHESSRTSGAVPVQWVTVCYSYRGSMFSPQHPCWLGGSFQLQEIQFLSWPLWAPAHTPTNTHTHPFPGCQD